MCLVINKSLLNELVYDENGFATVYKFMLLDLEGNLWSPCYGGKMELDTAGYYVSNRKSNQIEDWESNNNEIDWGIHTFITAAGAQSVIDLFTDWNFTEKVIRKYNRPEGSEFVVVEFKAHEDDFVSTGTLTVEETLSKHFPDVNFTNAVFTKVKFNHVL